jgi:hypothetical protein
MMPGMFGLSDHSKTHVFRFDPSSDQLVFGGDTRRSQGHQVIEDVCDCQECTGLESDAS